MGYKYNPFTSNFDRVSGSGGPTVETLTGNTGGPVAPDAAFNIDILGAGKYSFTGNPGTSTLTLDDDGTVAETYTGDSGSATPSAGNLNIFGDATQGSVTSGAGDTITITNTSATESQIGVTELATNAETITGTDTTRTIVPSALNAKLGTLTSNGLPYGQGSSSALGWTNALTNGQLVIGSSAGIPTAATITGGTGINVSNGANSITLSTHGSIPDSFPTDSGTATPSGGELDIVGGTGISTSGAGNIVTIDLDTPVVETDGGTGQSTYAQGDILYASAANTLSKLTAGSDGEVLTLASGIPSWAASSGGGFTIGTPQATTSGTAFDFTSIPSGTSVIHINLAGVSLSGTDHLLVQIGDSGGVETTGYTGSSSGIVTQVGSTSGIIIYISNASILTNGTLILTLFDSSTNTWVASGTFANNTALGGGVAITGGKKALSAELDRVRLTRTGTNTFDAGSVNIAYI